MMPICWIGLRVIRLSASGSQSVLMGIVASQRHLLRAYRRQPLCGAVQSRQWQNGWRKNCGAPRAGIQLEIGFFRHGSPGVEKDVLKAVRHNPSSRDYLTGRISVGNAEKRFNAGTLVVEIAELKPPPGVWQMLLGLDASLHTALKRKQSGAILNVAMLYPGIPGKHRANRHGSRDNSIPRKSSRCSPTCRVLLLQERLE